MVPEKQRATRRPPAAVCVVFSSARVADKNGGSERDLCGTSIDCRQDSSGVLPTAAGLASAGVPRAGIALGDLHSITVTHPAVVAGSEETCHLVNVCDQQPGVGVTPHLHTGDRLGVQSQLVLIERSHCSALLKSPRRHAGTARCPTVAEVSPR